jgi:SAM-dependent methyltransferase
MRFALLKTAAVLLGALSAGSGCGVNRGSGEDAAQYRSGAPEAEDGTGRFYMGREIARGLETEHRIDRPDSPDRDVRDLPDRLVAALELKPADFVADIGSGAGYYTLRLARQVPHGRVFAVDLQPALLDSVVAMAGAEGLRNVEPVLGTEADPSLPAERIDLALIVVSYHEFTHPREMIEGIVRALRPGGRLAIVEYRLEDATIPVLDVHRMSAGQIRAEMEAAGLDYREGRDVLPQQHLLFFRKPFGPR